MTSTQSGVQARRKHLASGRAHLKPHSRDLRVQPPDASSFIDFACMTLRVYELLAGYD